MNTAPANILLIEDESGMRTTLSANLEDQDYRVTACKTGKEGVIHIQQTLPDVVIADLRLPDMSGLELLGTLKEIKPEATFILVTGHASLETAVEALNEGAFAYVTKPFNMEEVFTIVRNGLRQQRLLLENQRLVENLQQINAKLAEEIAERRASQAALFESEEKYRTLFENSRDAIYICDALGWFVDVNRAAVDLFGYTKEAFMSLNIKDLYADPAGVEILNQKVIGTGSAQDLETRFQKRNGGELICILSATARHQKGDTISGYEGVIHDITDRKLLEEKLLQLQKMEGIGRLAGGVAHEFNNLLTPILGYTDLLLRQTQPEDESRVAMEEIHKASERAAILTEQLLAFSRRQVVEPKIFSLSELIVDAGRMLRRLIGEDVELVLLPAANIQGVEADPNQIHQILVNLVANARDAMPGGGKLTIETSNVTVHPDLGQTPDLAPGEYAMMTVADSGTGIPKEMKDHLFEPFFTTKEQGQGTGLGLATCYGIVKQSGGHIEVESGLGNGTKFRVYLPAVEKAISESNRRPVPQELIGGNEAILLAEDEPMVRKLASTILCDLGYSVLEASNGEEALRQAKDHAGSQIKLLVSDIVMPQMGGIELSEEFSSLHPDIPVILMSGYTDDVVSTRSNQGSVAAFIHKPFSPALLTQTVRDVLDQ